MNTPKPLIIALRRDANIERFIAEELQCPVVFYDLSESDLSRLSEVECIWIDMTTNLYSTFLEKFINLKYLVTPTTGLTHLHLSDDQADKVAIISLKGEKDFLNGITSTAELAWALALTVWRKIPLAAQQYSTDTGIRREFASLQLRGLNIGTVGFGRLGKMLSAYAKGFGMKTLFFDPFLESREYPSENSITRCSSLDQLCRASDIVFLVASHEKSNAAHYPILNRFHLNLLREHAIVVNVSRGSLIDEEALADLVLDSKIFGVGVDVLYREETGGKGLSRLQLLQEAGYNVVVTPHIGGICSDAFESAQRYVAKKLRKHILN